MAIRIIGNNTSFIFTSFFNTSAKITASTWNELVSGNFLKMQNVLDRVPSINNGTIVGSISSSVNATPGSSFISSRHVSILTSWTELNTFSSFATHEYDIVPKNVVSGPTVLNTFSNYWVFQTPGIYHINATIEYDVLIVPTMIRVAIVPYTNDGVNYGTSSPFDTSFTTRNNTMPVCLLAYTGKADDNALGKKQVSISGYVLVTSASSSNFPSITNVAVNKLNPLTAGGGYHIEVEGIRAFAGGDRFTITGGTVGITLVQEWWS